MSILKNRNWQEGTKPMESEKIIISDHNLQTRVDEVLDLCDKIQPTYIY